jgi:eukaryotic-like serine/threonine-protein kinase
VADVTPRPDPDQGDPPPRAPLGDLPPGTTVGEYRIDCVIGQGGMATVYGCTHPLIGKRAAIKVLSAALSFDSVAVERFIQEARAVNAIQHSNIVDVFSFGTLSDGRCYFVMELLSGETLYDRMQRARMPPAEAIAALLQMAAALEAAHEKKIVHRDVKPENVFVSPQRNGQTLVKLLDFGLVKLVDDKRGPRHTRAGCVIGTPTYMSPEQARGLDVDPRMDIYSLGVVAFEMFTGSLPFDGPSPFDILQQHVTAPPPLARTIDAAVPAAVEALLARMLAKNPDERPSLCDVVAELERIRETECEPAPAAGERRARDATPSTTWRIDPAPSRDVPAAPTRGRARAVLPVAAAAAVALLGVMAARGYRAASIAASIGVPALREAGAPAPSNPSTAGGSAALATSVASVGSGSSRAAAAGTVSALVALDGSRRRALSSRATAPARSDGAHRRRVRVRRGELNYVLDPFARPH